MKLSFREAAANTVTVPESFDEEETEAESDLSGESDRVGGGAGAQGQQRGGAGAGHPQGPVVRRVRRADRVVTDLLPLKTLRLAELRRDPRSLSTVSAMA